jgi:hypothetical protein
MLAIIDITCKPERSCSEAVKSTVWWATGGSSGSGEFRVLWERERGEGPKEEHRVSSLGLLRLCGVDEVGSMTLSTAGGWW